MAGHPSTAERPAQTVTIHTGQPAVDQVIVDNEELEDPTSDSEDHPSEADINTNTQSDPSTQHAHTVGGGDVEGEKSDMPEVAEEEVSGVVQPTVEDESDEDEEPPRKPRGQQKNFTQPESSSDESSPSPAPTVKTRKMVHQVLILTRRPTVATLVEVTNVRRGPWSEFVVTAIMSNGISRTFPWRDVRDSASHLIADWEHRTSQAGQDARRSLPWNWRAPLNWIAPP